MLLLLMFSTIMGVSTSSWMTTWVTLEVNTMVMCVMMSKEFKILKKEKMNILQYFVVQSTASMIILMAMSMKESEMSSMLLMTSMLMKMGAWPFHSWYLSFLENMETNTSSFLILLTWQKILPVYLMMSMVESQMMYKTAMLMALTSMMAPLMKMTKNMKPKLMLTLSSLNNNGWFIMTALMSTKTLLMLIMFYTIMTQMFLSWVKKEKSEEKLNKESWMSLMMVMNLSSVPPTFMFWAKLMVLKKMMENNMPELIMTATLLMSCMMIYFYMWSMMLSMMKKLKKTQHTLLDSNTDTLKMIMLTTPAPLFIMYSPYHMGFTLME